MMFLLGMHAMFGHDPPMNFRSTTATRFQSLANVHAASVDPVPSPRITRSYCSGCVFLSTRGDEALSAGVTRIFLSERQVHSSLALISREQRTMLIPATVHSQLLERCAPLKAG